eukprot:1505492-Pyramimonas_sp.AAC.1
MDRVLLLAILVGAGLAGAAAGGALGPLPRAGRWCAATCGMARHVIAWLVLQAQRVLERAAVRELVGFRRPKGVQV